MYASHEKIQISPDIGFLTVFAVSTKITSNHKYPRSAYLQTIRSDWADAQADLSFHAAQLGTLIFVGLFYLNLVNYFSTVIVVTQCNCFTIRLLEFGCFAKTTPIVSIYYGNYVKCMSYVNKKICMSYFRGNIYVESYHLLKNTLRICK